MRTFMKASEIHSNRRFLACVSFGTKLTPYFRANDKLLTTNL